MAAAPPRALGLAPHSGWAVAVVLGGSAREPTVIARERIELSDPELAGSKAPYHALEPLPLAEAAARLQRYEASAASLAAAVLAALLRRTGAVRGAGILGACGRGGASLGAILASHALIHGADGEHFRAALAGALGELEVPVTRIARQELLARATDVLEVRAAPLAERLAALGRGLGAPWGADQKAAALLAWLLLAAKS
jgi:hypothetical protein